MTNEPDNIEAAMDKVAETTSLGRSSNVGSEAGDPAQRQVLIRATNSDHDRWKRAAATQGVSLSEFIRDCLNQRTKELLECSHPLEKRKWYPWSETCMACGERLRSSASQTPKRQK